MFGYGQKLKIIKQILINFDWYNSNYCLICEKTFR